MKDEYNPASTGSASRDLWCKHCGCVEQYYMR